jgi:hypothetical protein
MFPRSYASSIPLGKPLRGFEQGNKLALLAGFGLGEDALEIRPLLKVMFEPAAASFSA